MIKGKKGAAFAWVVMVMAVLAILGTSILSISLAETKQAVYQDKRMQAFYLARSGAHATAQWMLKNPLIANTLLNRASTQNHHFSNGWFEVRVEPGTTAKQMIIKADGYVGGVSNGVKLIVSEMESSDIVDKAIYTDEALNITGMKVYGDVQSALNIQYSTNGSNSYNNTAFPNSPRVIELEPFPNPPVFPDITSNEIKNEEITATGISFSYNGITCTGATLPDVAVRQNGVLTLQPNGSVFKVVVDNLTIDNELRIDTSLGGRVELYVKNNLTVTTSGIINNTTPKNLVIFLEDGSSFIIQANMVLNGYIIGPDATVEVQSNSSIINGSIIADVVRKNNAGNGPNGVVNFTGLSSDVDITDLIKAFKILRWEDR